jgi:hypothetical protein
MNYLDSLKLMIVTMAINTKANMGAVIAFMGTAIVLYVGLPVIGGVITAANISATSPLYPVYTALNSTLVSGYGVMGLSLLIIGVVTILGYFGWGRMFS